MRNLPKVSTGSIPRWRQTITNSTISSRRSPRSYFETYDCGTSSLAASSTWPMWARLRTSRRNAPRLSFSLWKSLRYRTRQSANILSKVILEWVITRVRIFQVKPRLFAYLGLAVPLLNITGCSCDSGHSADTESAGRLSIVAGKVTSGTSRTDLVRLLGEPKQTSTSSCQDDLNATCEEAYWEIGSENHVIYCDFRNQALVSAQEGFERTDTLPHCTLQLDGSGKCWDHDDHVFDVAASASGRLNGAN